MRLRLLSSVSTHAALVAAARAALAAPDREVAVDVAAECGMSPETKAKKSTASGRILLRIPKTLHEKLLEEAKREGVSLNQFTAGALAGAVS